MSYYFVGEFSQRSFLHLVTRGPYHSHRCCHLIESVEWSDCKCYYRVTIKSHNRCRRLPFPLPLPGNCHCHRHLHCHCQVPVSNQCESRCLWLLPSLPLPLRPNVYYHHHHQRTSTANFNHCHNSRLLFQTYKFVKCLQVEDKSRSVSSLRPHFCHFQKLINTN